MSTVISVEHLSKSYRLGAIGGNTLREDLSRLWAKIHEKPDPALKVDETHQPALLEREFWALQDVNFEVGEGDILGVIGRNGAGKSTLLKILSRVTGPTAGFVKIKGRIASLLEVGTGFHPELTGRENIFLNGAILGMTKGQIYRRFEEIVAFSEISQFIDTPVKRYSSGMYVRLAFAVAAHLEPEILIIDEVLAVGDLQFQKKCLGKMGEVSREGRTVLFVSHNLDAVRNLCSSALILDKGRVAFNGSVEGGVEHYLASAASTSGVAKFVPSHRRGTPFFHSASVINHLGCRTAACDVRQGFSVEMTYEIPQPLRNLEVAIRVLTSDAHPVFTSIISEAMPELLERVQEGKRTAVASIPGNFLMPGTYFINIALHESVGQVFDLKEAALSVTIEDTGTIFTKYNMNHHIGVVLRPLAWTCSAEH